MFIDSHCHLDFSIFDAERVSLIKRCHEQSVDLFIVPSTRRQSWLPLYQLSQQFAEVVPAYGIHPYFTQTQALSDVESLGLTCEQFDAVAIGEIGLDQWPGSAPLPQQLAFFNAQISVANSLTLPVILHARKSYDLVYSRLKTLHFKQGGIVHAFNGSYVQAQRFLELGFVLGIGGNITYPRANKLRRTLISLNVTDFVLETDAPDMPIMGKQGQINTPLSILPIAAAVAHIRSETTIDIARYTTANVGRILPKVLTRL